ncbi:MAG TPA: F0F1 ATP synthase subunit gamma [Acidimicrobiia bacterium]|nr:F0F1 ATP synthase subunit gamma [Acidimicrobiia bacterium]
MAGGQERILRRRIRSVQATKKITRAMELIAASRIVKAQARVHAAVPYADGITEVVRDLQAAGAGGNNPLLVPRPEIRRVAHVVIAADRGLCGAYNSSVIRAAEAEMRDHAQLGRDYSLVTVGRKAEGYFRFRNFRIDAAFSGFTESPSYEDARAVAGAVAGRFQAGELDLVQLVYTRFVSAGRQEVVVRPLLPLDQDDFAGGDGKPAPGASGAPTADYEFEPTPDAILDALLPRYADARVYAALLNAAASEHAARQRAMKAATDNAEELITTLTRVMNRARQDAITTEIMEIVGGAEALRASQGHDDPGVDANFFESTSTTA